MTVWSRIAASAVKLPPPQTTAVSVERGLTRQDARRRRAAGRPLVPDDDPAASRRPCSSARRTGARIMGPLGRLYAERGYQVVVQSCRGTFGSGGEFVPVRNEQADGQATLEWVAAQPWFDGRLVMWGASYLGMTQWAVAQDAPGLPAGAQPPGHGGQLPRLGRLPRRRLRARDGAGLAARDQEPGARVAHRAAARACAAPGWWRRRARCCPLGKCDSAAIGEPMAFYQDWLEHSTPGDPWWDAVDFGRRLDKVPPASFIGGWYDLFLRAQVDDYEALRRAGRTARLTIGPWTHASPGLFAETVRDGPRWFDSQLGAGRDGRRAPGRAGARLRHGLAHVAGVLHVAAGGEDRAVVPRARRHAGARPRRRPRTAPRTATTTTRNDPTPSVGGPSLNMATAGRKEQSRRERRRDVLTYTSPVLTEDLTVIGPVTATLYVRSSLEHTDFFVRLCDVTEKGKSFNLSDGIVRLTPGSVEPGRRTASPSSRSPCGPRPTPSGPATASACRSPAAPTRSSTATRVPASRWPPAPTCARPTRRSSTTPARPSAVALHVVPLLEDGALGGRGMGPPDPLG